MKRVDMLAAAFVLLVAAPAAVAGPTIADLQLGEHWYGPNVSLDDLKGRVVLVEMWGKN